MLLPSLGRVTPFAADDGERCDEEERDRDFGLAIVVLRPIFSVSGAEGGGGRLERREEDGRMETRQRKHSPLP